MRGLSIPVVVAILITLLFSDKIAAQFVLFPKAAQTISPNRRFVVRNQDREVTASDFAGSSNSLWLTEISSGRSQKLCDYVGVAAVGWSGSEYVMVTQYVGKKTSRMLLFPTSRPEDAVLIDVPALIRMVPIELRPTLRENDHIFIEASRVESDTMRMSVWGYGPHDKNGFRWRCEYALREDSIVCADALASH